MTTVEILKGRLDTVRSPNAPSSAWRNYAFLAGLALLFPAEIVAVTLCFHPGQGVDAGTWWSEVVRFSTHLPAIALRFALPSAFGGIFLAALLGRLPARVFTDDGAVRLRLPLLGLHALALAAFVVLTWRIAAGACLTSAFPGVLVLSWALSGVILAASWAVSLLPSTSWMGLAWPMVAAMVAGGLLNLAAIALRGASEQLWHSFNRATFWTAHGVLSLVFTQTICDPEQLVLGTGQFQVQIAPACSGYEGIGLITLFLGGYLLLFRRQLRFPEALILLPIGIGLMWLLNAVRLAGLVALGTWATPEIAIEGFHSQAGWLAFNFVALGAVAVSHHAGVFRRSPISVDAAPNPTAAFLVPFMSLVLGMMLTRVFFPGFDWGYPLRISMAAAVLWYFRGSYAELRLSWSWVPVAVGVAVFGLWLALEPLYRVDPAGRDLGDDLESLPLLGSATWLAFRILGSVVIVPLVEELAFRGYLLRRLINADFRAVAVGRLTWLSLGLSSLLFGLVHGRWFAAILAGLCYGLVLRRRGELCDAVLAHGTTNALIVVYVLATQTWSLWS